MSIRKERVQIDLIIRALSSNENTAVKENTLHSLSGSLSKDLDIPFKPEFLAKRTVTKKLSHTGSESEREQLLED